MVVNLIFSKKMIFSKNANFLPKNVEKWAKVMKNTVFRLFPNIGREPISNKLKMLPSYTLLDHFHLSFGQN